MSYSIQNNFDFAEAVPNEISGHIDIVNETEIPLLTKNAFGGTIPSEMFSVSKSRWRGNFITRDATWGIRETAKSSYSRVSNAVCLSGDLLSFYIEPEGYGVGVLGDTVVFAKTSLEITIYDILRNESKSIVFDGFSLPANDPNRFIAFKLPDEDSYSYDFFAENGINGLMLMRIREISEFHQRADWTDTFSYAQDVLPQYNDSYVQISIYPWNLPLREFDFSNAEQNVAISNESRFITSNVDSGDSTKDVFSDHTYFPLFRRVSNGLPVDLLSYEKDYIIRRNVMALISSQLPFLNASAPIGPVLGLGMSEVPLGIENQESPISRPKAWPEFESTSKSSTCFSLTGSPPLINTLQGLNDFAYDNAQLSSVSRNPLRVLLNNSDSDKTETSFALLGQQTSGIVVPSNIGNCENVIILGEKTNQEVSVSLSFDNNAESSSSEPWQGCSVTISFTTNIPIDKIRSVSFSVAINDFNFYTFTYPTGSLNHYTFYTEDFEKTITSNSIIYGRVGIEDEDGKVTYWYSKLNLSIQNEKYSISELNVSTRRDGSGIVDIYYSLEAPFEISSANIQLQASIDNGKSWNSPTTFATGDIGDQVPIGQKRHIFWNPLRDIPSAYENELIIRIIAISPLGQYAIGNAKSGAIYIPVSKMAYLSEYIDGIRQGVFDNTFIKEQFLPTREIRVVLSSSSSFSTSSISFVSSSSLSSLNSSTT